MKKIQALLMMTFWMTMAASLAMAQQPSPASLELGSISTPRTINPAANSTTPSSLAGQQQNPFLGSVPTGRPTAEPLELSLADAIARGLRFNLGVIENQASVRQAQALKVRALSTMVPSASALMRQNLDQLSIVAIGIKAPGLPISTGQFSYQEAYVAFSDAGLNMSSLYLYQASHRGVETQRLSLEDAKNVVVLAVGTAYLQVQASAARVETVRAELDVARELEAQATNRVRSGLAAEIEGLRAAVQRQTSEQRLTVVEANLEKDKLTLARVIGLPNGQPFNISTAAAYQAWTGGDLTAALHAAQENRADLKSARSAAEASRLSKHAAEWERAPGISFNGYYGSLGPTLGNATTTYAMTATLSVPLFTGGRIRSDIIDASAQLDRKQSEYLDLEGRVDYEVRNAFTDLDAAESAVHVAEKNTRLSQQTLDQARDRFANGVANNLEVVQAQQDVAAATENYISSLFAHNLAKLTLLRAMGLAQKDVNLYLGGK
jgi:outer membrane protein TolC